MAGNSQRRGAGSRGRGNTAGSGGRIRRGLRGKGPTPKAEDRPYHKAYKAKQAAQAKQPQRKKSPQASGAEWVIGRNSVLEALQAGIPVHTAYVAEGVERDDRMRDIIRIAAERGMPMLQVTRGELDRMTRNGVHQGIALQLPTFEYADPADLMGDALVDDHPLVVALDHVTDPRNLGAVIRSAAAFGAQGVLIPERRAAGMTAAAWKTSAGAAARLPVARTVNLNRELRRYAEAGFHVVGLAGEADQDLASVGLDGPILLVVGSEGTGLARLVRENCDVLASIPISSTTESLNASVAAGIALYEISRQRPA